MSIVYKGKFEFLSAEIKDLAKNRMELLDKHSHRPLPINGSRSEIEELQLENESLILKRFTTKGSIDQDIEALNKLQGSSFYPKLYAYKDSYFLLMEKVKGTSLENLLINKKIDISELKIVKEQYLLSVKEAAFEQLINYDEKLDQIFWEPDQNKLSVIDLGLFDTLLPQVQSIEDVIQRSSEWFDKETSYYIKRQWT